MIEVQVVEVSTICRREHLSQGVKEDLPLRLQIALSHLGQIYISLVLNSLEELYQLLFFGNYSKVLPRKSQNTINIIRCNQNTPPSVDITNPYISDQPIFVQSVEFSAVE